MYDFSPEELRINLCTALPVDIISIASRLKYQVKDVPLESADALIISYPKQLIIVKEGVSEHRKRFSIAHEIGHLMLGHAFGDLLCNSIGTARFSRNVIACERDADFYASELLIPTMEIEADIKNEFSLDFAVNLAYIKYNVSIECYLIRFAQLADFPIAILYIEGRTLKWKTISSSWFEEIDLSNFLLFPEKRKTHCSEWMDNDFNYDDFYVIQEKLVYAKDNTILVLYSQDS